MESSKRNQSLLFQVSLIEPKDDVDETLEKCHNVYLAITRNVSEQNMLEALRAQMGQLYVILTDPKSGAKTFRDMTILSRDGLTCIIGMVNQIIHEKWLKLTDGSRTQVVWLCREMVRNSVATCESLCHSLIRQIAGGDVTPKNIWLTEFVLDMFIENRKWLDGVGWLIPMVVYTFLRTIVDHNIDTLTALQQKETELCVSLLREKWADCQTIGRDLVRLLQYVARLPEFDALWKDILFNPASLSPEFTGLTQLMRSRTSRKFLISRLTPDMEKKVHYITTQVKFGQQKRYQDWLQRQYLNTPESQSLRCDLIRYICAVVHPTNEQLCSDIIPRWAVIGWLLTTCTSNVAASNAKLSLFYDWLFFDQERDSIMNIEPCILVMHHSLRPHPAITATLLDFMCRILPHFCPMYREEVREGIFNSLRTLLERRVLPSFEPLFDNNKLDKELRKLVRHTFPEFLSEVQVSSVKDEPMPAITLPAEEISLTNNHVERALSETSITSDPGDFSDDDDDDRVMKPDIGSSLFKLLPHSQLDFPKLIPEDIGEYVDKLEGEIRTHIEDLRGDRTSNEVKCEIMDRLVQAIVSFSQEDDFDQDMATLVATCICQITLSQFNASPFPHNVDEDSLEDSVSMPLYVIFRNLCSTPEENPARQPVLMLLEEMYNIQPRLGYHFLYFLKVGKVHDEKMSAYKDLCKSMETRDLSSCLRKDLRVCQEDDVRLFVFLVPDIFREFGNMVIGKPDVLQLVVSCIDGAQLQSLVGEILQDASLEWETIEQYFLWQLILAHEMPIETVMPVLPKLDYIAHAEILTNIILSVKQDAPTMDLLRPILCRGTKTNDYFAVSILKYWATEYEEKLADFLYTLLSKPKESNTQPKKRQKPNKLRSMDGPTPEHILSHLDQMRLTCRNISFLTNETIQQALQAAQLNSSDSLRNKFSDLFALAEPEDYTDMGPRRVLRQVASRRASQAASTSASGFSPKGKKKQPISSESDSDSSDEETKRPKKRKRMGDDDSD